MKYHLGLLDERPDRSRTLRWVKTPNWHALPPEIDHELRVWMAMPGFTSAYHQHTLGQGRTLIDRSMGGYDQYKAEVAENWLSATREDCVKLSRLRPGLGDVPLICQMRAVQDLKTMSQEMVARDYNVKRHTVMKWKNWGFNFRGPLPSGFELLVG